MQFIKRLTPFIIVILFSYWAVVPFFQNGFFPMHDDTQVARVFEMHQALSDGMVPVRWVSDLGYGYGYPIFNFYAPLAYYVGGLINFVTDSLTATKIMMVVGILLSGTFMYLFASVLWGRIGGMISALLYVYAPYHALNIYVRGDVAEIYAYAFIPLVFFGVYKIFLTLNEKSKKLPLLWICVGACGYAGVILSHNLSAMMLTPFLFGFVMLLLFLVQQKKQFILSISSGFLLALLLSAFYWLPVFPEMQYTDVLSQVGGGADYKDHFVCPTQLWDSPWGYGGSTKTCFDGFSLKIGKVHLVLGLLVVTLFLISFANKNVLPQKFYSFTIQKINNLPILLFLVVCLLVSIFLMLNSSQFIWDSLSPMAFFQYPWRFLLMTSFFISLLGGAITLLLPDKQKFIFYGAVLIISASIIVINAEVFVPQMSLNKTAMDYTNSYALRWDASRLTDEYLPPEFHEPQNPREVPQEKVNIPTGAGELTFYNERTQQITADVMMQRTSSLLIQHAYFPAWHVFIDGKEVSYEKLNQGMLLAVPQGKHTIELRFIQTPIEQVGNILSIAGILVLILGIIVSQKEILYAKKTT